ncbi:hypothetical protein [Tateyamaria sp. SN3-11]|uniref:hypothetical protein n=1 Tax=Tateyamaria sp. SN3-11 TaxID=3092147 RepID=UPI0039ECECDF
MIMRIIMRKAINKGIDAGVNKVSRGRKQPRQQQMDYDEAMDDGPTQAEIRQQRQAKRAARQARQAAKAGNKINRM